MRQKYLTEKRIKESAFVRLEGLRMEIKAIDSDSQSYDVWKEKCKELFALCKELQKENEDLRNFSQINEMHPMTTPDIASIPENLDSMTSKTHDEKLYKKSKRGDFGRFGAKTITTKPSTAAQNRAMQERKQGYMSGGSLANALGINPSEMSPRGSVISSGMKKVFSKASHQMYDPDAHKMPNINNSQYYKNIPKSQSIHHRQRRMNQGMRGATMSNKRNP